MDDSSNQKEKEAGQCLKREDWMTEPPDDLWGEAKTISKSKKDEQFRKPVPIELKPGLVNRDGSTDSMARQLRRPSTEASLEWTKIKIQRILDQVKRDKAQLEQVAIDRFGSLENFRNEVDTIRHLLDPSWINVIYKSDPEETKEIVANVNPMTMPTISQPTSEDINKLVARKMKAELAGNVQLARALQRDIEQLQSESHRSDRRAIAITEKNSNNVPKSANLNDSINELVRDEKLGAHNEFDSEYARKLSRCSRYVDSIEGLDDFSDQYCKDGDDKRPKKRTSSHQVGQSRSDGKQVAKKTLYYDKVIANCWFCFDSDYFEQSLLLATGQFTYLALPKYGQLDPLHCCIIPHEHISSWRQADEDSWTELRNFQKCLLQLAHQLGRTLVFLESAPNTEKYPNATTLKKHAVIEAIPVPKTGLGTDIQAYFKKALSECDVEWSSNERVIETAKRGGLRRSIPANFGYLYVDFGLDKGFVHVVEDDTLIEKDFMRTIMASLYGWTGKSEWKAKYTEKAAKEKFLKLYDPFDWTRMLHEAS